MKAVITLVFLIFIQISYGQYRWTPCELYLKSGKVLKGEAKLIAHNPGNLAPLKERVKFRTSKKSKKQKIGAKLIDHIIFTVTYKDKEKVEKTRKEKYIAMYLKKKKKHLRFVQIIIDGKVKLVGRQISSGGYYGGVSTGGGVAVNPTPTGLYAGNHNQLLLVKGNHIPEKFNHKSIKKSFKKRAIAFFSDCKALVNKLENKVYKKEDLIAITEYYNSNCQ